MRKIIKKILKEETKSNIKVGNIYSMNDSGRLIRIESVECYDEPDRKTITRTSLKWGVVTTQHDGCYVSYKASDNGGMIWYWPDGDDEYRVDKNWINFIVNQGYWKLILEGGISFFDSLNESTEDIKYLRKGQPIYCHTSIGNYKAGDWYIINSFREGIGLNGEDVISIYDGITEYSKHNHWTVQKDHNYLNYENWFTIIPEDIRGVEFFEPLKESEEDEFEWAKEVVSNPIPTTSMLMATRVQGQITLKECFDTNTFILFTFKDNIQKLIYKDEGGYIIPLDPHFLEYLDYLKPVGDYILNVLQKSYPNLLSVDYI